MNKAELVGVIAQKSGLTKKDSEKAINAFVERVKEALAKGERVSLVGFGTFEVRERKACKGRNPQTKTEIVIPGGKSPAFKAGKELKEVVAK